MSALCFSCGMLLLTAWMGGYSTQDTSVVLVTPEGTEIVLKADNTWEFKDGRPPVIEKDITIPLSDGRIVYIGENRSWGFVEKELKKEEDEIRTTKIVGMGMSKHLGYDQALHTAKQKVLDNTCPKMQNALIKKKIDRKALKDCVRRVEKEEEVQNKFKEGVGWEVKVIWTLDRGSILAVADCAAVKEEKKEEGK